MQRIGEIEQRILSELEEAGGENVPTLLNTITRRTGYSSELAQVQKALEKLVQRDLVRTAVQSNPPTRLQPMSKDESLALVADLRSNCCFLEVEKYWTCIRKPYPEILITSPGRSMAGEILELRGYQWWRRKK